MVYRKDYLNPGKVEPLPVKDERSWYDWLFGIYPPKPMKPWDAAHHLRMRQRFITFLDNSNPPDTFQAKDVAKAFREEELKLMGYEKWQEAVPGVIELAFELRAFGDLEVLLGGEVVPEDVMAMEMHDRGDCRIRRVVGKGWFDE